MDIFQEMKNCGKLDFVYPPLVEVGETGGTEPEQDANKEEEYSDEEMNVDELKRRMWEDRIRLRHLKEKNKAKEDSAKHRQSQEQTSRKNKSRAQDGILKCMLKMMDVCKAQGFVYGILPEMGKPMTGASNNLLAWWEEKARFDRNGPTAISKYQADHSLPGNSEDFGSTGEEEYSDEEMYDDELEKRMWQDRMTLKRLKEQNKAKGGGVVDSTKQRQSQEQPRREKMFRAQRGILKYMLKVMDVCKGRGFVYGIISEQGKPVSGASDNLRAWWIEKVCFDRNGPVAISKYQADHSLPRKNEEFGFL